MEHYYTALVLSNGETIRSIDSTEDGHSPPTNGTSIRSRYPVYYGTTEAVEIHSYRRASDEIRAEERPSYSPRDSSMGQLRHSNGLHHRETDTLSVTHSTATGTS